MENCKRISCGENKIFPEEPFKNYHQFEMMKRKMELQWANLY